MGMFPKKENCPQDHQKGFLPFLLLPILCDLRGSWQQSLFSGSFSLRAWSKVDVDGKCAFQQTAPVDDFMTMLEPVPQP